MQNKNIVLLAGQGISSNIVFNALDEVWGISKAIVEEKESREKMISRRIKKLGYFTVAGQLIFQTLVVPLLKKNAAKRIVVIFKENYFNTHTIPADKLVSVSSVNNQATADIINAINPAVVIVNGTRIISKKILSNISCPVINMHVGITPAYRGVHGGYWALVNNDTANCGVTIHLVDAGIDTGAILYQDIIVPSAKDNFISYPYLQLASGISLLKKAVEDALAGKLNPYTLKGKSGLWYHPTVWQYFYNRLFKKVK